MSIVKLGPKYEWHISHSKQLGYVLIIMYLLAFVAIWTSAITFVSQGALTTCLFLHGYYTATKKENWQLTYTDENGWQITPDNDKPKLITILKSTVITRLVICLHYRHDMTNNYRYIFKDALLNNHNTYRQLIVTLKTNGL